MSKSTKIAVELSLEDWDFLTTVLDVAHSEAQNQVDELKATGVRGLELSNAKDHATMIERILDDIADHISGVTTDEED